MPKPKPSRKIIKQEMLWPTPYWYTHIWEFMRSETRVTFNEDMIGSINGMIEKNEGDLYNNRGNLYYRMKNYPSAINDFKKFSELQPGNEKAFLI